MNANLMLALMTFFQHRDQEDHAEHPPCHRQHSFGTAQQDSQVARPKMRDA